MDNTLLNLLNSAYPTQPPSLIANELSIIACLRFYEHNTILLKVGILIMLSLCCYGSDKSRFYLYHTKHQTNQTKRYNAIYCFVDASLHFVPSKRVVIVNEKSVEPSWDLSYKGRAFLPHFCKPQGEKHTINRPNWRCPPSLHALKDWWGKSDVTRGFSGGKQVINFSNTRNRGWVCLLLTIENEQLFTLKTIMENYGRVEVNIFSCFGYSSNRRCPQSKL